MKDLYLGDLIEGELYETFDGYEIYISKLHVNHCVVYERKRGTSNNWTWNLRTVSYLRRNIRTIIDMM